MAQLVKDRVSLIDLTQDMIGSIKELAAAHGDLLKAEVREGTRQASSAMILSIISGLVLFLGVLFALIGLVYWLPSLVGVSIAGAWAIVAVVLIIAGLICLSVTRNAWSQASLVPNRTINSLQESYTWLRKR
jgi:hypothetical protein